MSFSPRNHPVQMKLWSSVYRRGNWGSVWANHATDPTDDGQQCLDLEKRQKMEPYLKSELFCLLPTSIGFSFLCKVPNNHRTYWLKWSSPIKAVGESVLVIPKGHVNFTPCASWWDSGSANKIMRLQLYGGTQASPRKSWGYSYNQSPSSQTIHSLQLSIHGNLLFTQSYRGCPGCSIRNEGQEWNLDPWVCSDQTCCCQTQVPLLTLLIMSCVTLGMEDTKLLLASVFFIFF